MKITNKTKYPTKLLRSLITDVHARIAKHDGRLRSWKYLRVEVVYTRRHDASGWARYDGSFTKLRLARGGVDSARAAQLVDHEFFHLYGFKHKSYVSCGYYTPEALAKFSWAHERFGAKLEERGPKPKPTLDDRRGKRLSHAQAKVEEWEKKMATAERQLKKWAKRAKAVQRAVPAAASGEEAAA